MKKKWYNQKREKATGMVWSYNKNLLKRTNKKNTRDGYKEEKKNREIQKNLATTNRGIK